MVIIFDLDDTLYDESTYVQSGFRAVAAFGATRFGWEPDKSFRFMNEALNRMGRGAIFDRWLEDRGSYSKGLVRECIQVYRNHTPVLRLYDDAKTLLTRIANYPLYVVTDGHKLVQQKKVQALGVGAFFRHIYITHRYGIRHAKPSTYCFQLLRARERCDWKEMIYVGDNPDKDFVNLNHLCVHTVRVLTGCHRGVKARPGYGARHTIDALGQFEKLLESL